MDGQILVRDIFEYGRYFVGEGFGEAVADSRIVVRIGEKQADAASGQRDRDLEADVGLVEIASRKLLTVARVADPVAGLSAGPRLIAAIVPG